MATIDLNGRFRGALIGLAVGDALGAAIEFRPPGTFKPVEEMTGGGPFKLEPGQWTDDTSMALCLAASLVECGDFDPSDQMQRYLRWLKQGYLSSTGRCLDVGNTVRAALARFEFVAQSLQRQDGRRFGGQRLPDASGAGPVEVFQGPGAGDCPFGR